MKTGIVIVAGGSGVRMGGAVPKQFLLLAGKPLLMHTIERFACALPEAERIVVLPADQLGHWAALCEEYAFETEHGIVAGGRTRFHSVKNGLEKLSGCDYVGVHDGVRPLVAGRLAIRVLEAARSFGAAVPAVPVTDSLREIFREKSAVASGSEHIRSAAPGKAHACPDAPDSPHYHPDMSKSTDGPTAPEDTRRQPDASWITRSRPADRENFVAVQTPQFFCAQTLVEAYRQTYRPEFTDDASVVEAFGHPVVLVPGDPLNLKVTTPADLAAAQALLAGSFPF